MYVVAANFYSKNMFELLNCGLIASSTLKDFYIQTLPGAFLHIAQGLKEPKLRADYRQRLLVLCSDVSLVAESQNGRFVTILAFLIY